MIDQLPWSPTAGPEMLQARAKLLADIRSFFQNRGILEVETPICSAHATTDPVLESLSTSYAGPGASQGQDLYLHTSPEFPMKRLLAADSGPIYQICKVFRNGEVGRMHNPEFTLLEWYRPGFDHQMLMDEVADLINSLLPEPLHVERFSYAELFQKYLGVDPHRADVDELRNLAIEQDISGVESLELANKDGWLDLLLSHCIEPQLGLDSICFIYDYPATQASLAKIRSGSPPLAERFELYMDGIELANGFHELTSAEVQRKRFQAELELRREQGLTEPPVDDLLLAAMEQGIPDCAGVALGVDRLLMRLTDASHIDEVLAFPLGRA